MSLQDRLDKLEERQNILEDKVWEFVKNFGDRLRKIEEKIEHSINVMLDKIIDKLKVEREERLKFEEGVDRKIDKVAGRLWWILGIFVTFSISTIGTMIFLLVKILSSLE